MSYFKSVAQIKMVFIFKNSISLFLILFDNIDNDFLLVRYRVLEIFQPKISAETFYSQYQSSIEFQNNNSPITRSSPPRG